MSLMRLPLRQLGRKIGPAWGASIAAHVALMAGLFLVLGIWEPAAERRQVSTLSQVPAAEPPPPVPPPLEPLPPEAPPPPPEPDLEEVPPLEPDPFVAEVIEVDPTDVPLPPAERPVDFPTRPKRAPISAGTAPSPAPPPARPPVRAPPPSASPVAEKSPRPTDPARAVRRNLEGRVLLLVEVRPDGSVGEIRVKESSGHAILDQAAQRAVREWHFRPALARGQPVRSWVEVPITFRLTE